MKRIIVSAMTAAVVFGLSTGLAGCGADAQANQSNTIRSASVEPSDSSVNISVTGYRLGRGVLGGQCLNGDGSLVRFSRSAEGSRLRPAADEQFKCQDDDLAHRFAVRGARWRNIAVRGAL